LGKNFWDFSGVGKKENMGGGWGIRGKTGYIPVWCGIIIKKKRMY